MPSFRPRRAHQRKAAARSARSLCDDPWVILPRVIWLSFDRPAPPCCKGQMHTQRRRGINRPASDSHQAGMPAQAAESLSNEDRRARRCCPDCPSAPCPPLARARFSSGSGSAVEPRQNWPPEPGPGTRQAPVRKPVRRSIDDHAASAQQALRTGSPEPSTDTAEHMAQQPAHPSVSEDEMIDNSGIAPMTTAREASSGEIGRQKRSAWPRRSRWCRTASPIAGGTDARPSE